MPNPRPLMALSFVDYSGPDRSCATGEAVIGQGVMPVVSRVAGTALFTRILAYVVVPTGTVTLRVRIGDPTSGTVLATLTQGVTAGAVAEGSGTYAAPGTPERFFLTGVTSAGTTVIKTASMMFVGDAEPLEEFAPLSETVPLSEEVLAASMSGAVINFTAPLPGPRVRSYDPLGGGMVRAIYRTLHGDFASDQGIPLVLSNIGQVLGTRRGTLPWRPTFGSDLDRLRHQANTPGLRELAAVYVREALSSWEPRVTLSSLSVDTPLPGSSEARQIVLRASLGIEGASGRIWLDLPLGARDGTAIAEPRNYSINSSERHFRGMRYMLPAPTGIDLPTELSELPSRGLTRPVGRNSRDFASAAGVAEILSNVGQVLGTQKGTIPWRPEFGSDLQRLRHQANTPGLRELARVYVAEALGRWEPRAHATKVEVLTPGSTDENVVTVRALCRIAFGEADTVYPISVQIK